MIIGGMAAQQRGRAACSPLEPTGLKIWNLALEDFCDAICVDPHRFGPAEINQQTVVFWRTDISGILECVLRAIVKPDGKWSKRTPFDQLFDLCNFHGEKIASNTNPGKPEL